MGNFSCFGFYEKGLPLQRVILRRKTDMSKQYSTHISSFY